MANTLCICFQFNTVSGNELLNYVLHGFHFQNLVPNRFSCFFIFLVVTIFYDIVINYRDIMKGKSVILFSIYALIILLLIYINKGFDAESCISSVIFVIIYVLIVLNGYKKNHKYNNLRALLLVLSFELIFTAAMNVKSKGIAFVLSENSISVAKNFSETYGLDDDLLQRTEVINGDNYNDAKKLTFEY